jgi:hypothetical protein
MVLRHPGHNVRCIRLELSAMLSENANVVKRSPRGRGCRFIHQSPADDGHADGQISDPVFGKRQQIILQDNKEVVPCH